ncbi:hypothetical protein [Thalassobaculum sp.]|uniref:hypothetical protein n=1 Tax=Thalassobaculum sp. TaxID=2022740 RepID=UPI0032EEAB86
MRRIRAATLALGLLLIPMGAAAQTAAPAAAPAAADAGWSTTAIVAVSAGAVVGVVALNAVTGGAMLAPMAGPAISNALGGSILGPATLSVAARQALCRTTTVLTAAAVGAGLGYWVVSE